MNIGGASHRGGGRALAQNGPSPTAANPVLLQLVKNWCDDAWEHNHKGYYSLRKAYDSLNSTAQIFDHPSQAGDLKFWGPKLTERLVDDYGRYCQANGLPMPEAPRKKTKKRASKEASVLAANADVEEDLPVPKRPRKERPYVPKPRTGGYAILLALFEEGDGIRMTKDRLIERAQPYCDSSFTISDPGKSYTAWSCVNALMDKNLVYVNGNPKRYQLTEAGEEIARGIAKVENQRASEFDNVEEGGKNGGRNRRTRGGGSIFGALPRSRDRSNATREEESEREKTKEKAFRTRANITATANTTTVATNRAKSHTSQITEIRTLVESQSEDEWLDLTEDLPIKTALGKAAPKLSSYKTSLKENGSTAKTASLSATINMKSASGSTLEDKNNVIFSTLYERSDYVQDIPPLSPIDRNARTISKPTRLSTEPSTLSVDKPSSARLLSPPWCPKISSAAPPFPKFSSESWPPHSFTVHLLLDNREVRAKHDRDYLQRELTNLGVSVLTRPLHIGDIMWIAKHNITGAELVLDHIVERKRLDDLVGSLKDGRFHEQKWRLKKSGIGNVIYLVEETVNISSSWGWGGSGDQLLNGDQHLLESLQTSISSTQVVNGYFVKRTSKIDDTIRYLARLTKLFIKLYTAIPHCHATKKLHVIPDNLVDSRTFMSLKAYLRNKHPDREYATTYPLFSELVDKSASLTLRDLLVKMLMCIRGVSAEKAIEITKHYGTPRELLEAFERADRESGDGEKSEVGEMLSEICNGFGRRKVGTTLSRKVAEIWWGDSYCE